MTSKRRGILWFTLLLLLLCIAWQYCLFKEEQRALKKALYQLQSAYASMKKAPLLHEKTKSLDTSMAKLVEKIPIGDYQNEAFLRSLRTLCLLNGTIYQLLDRRFHDQVSYSVEQYHFKIHGMRTSVERTVMEIEKMQRLINWDTLCLSKPLPRSKRVELHFSLTIYHLNPIKLPTKQIIKRPKIEIQTWLPPFSFLLKNLKIDVQTTYEFLTATYKAEELLHQVQEYTWKMNRFQQIQSIKNHLGATRTPLASYLEALPLCSLSDSSN